MDRKFDRNTFAMAVFLVAGFVWMSTDGAQTTAMIGIGTQDNKRI
jgi:hypothetical protein